MEQGAENAKPKPKLKGNKSMLKKKSSTKTVWNTPDLLVREYFVRDDIENLGFAIAKLDGKYGENRNKAVDQVIYVIDGRLLIEINNQSYILEKEDAILIRRGTWYSVEGKGEFAVITSPAWFLEQYETREPSDKPGGDKCSP